MHVGCPGLRVQRERVVAQDMQMYVLRHGGRVDVRGLRTAEPWLAHAGGPSVLTVVVAERLPVAAVARGYQIARSVSRRC